MGIGEGADLGLVKELGTAMPQQPPVGSAVRLPSCDVVSHLHEALAKVSVPNTTSDSLVRVNVTE